MVKMFANVERTSLADNSVKYSRKV